MKRKNSKVILIGLSVFIGAVLISGCKSAPAGATGFIKEDSALTGYGSAAKSTLRIEDFFFINDGTSRTVITDAVGSENYLKNNENARAVYELINGDKLTLEYDSDNMLSSAVYGYSNGEDEDFMDMLVTLGVRNGAQGGADGPNGAGSNNPDTGENNPSGSAGSGGQDGDGVGLLLRRAQSGPGRLQPAPRRPAGRWAGAVVRSGPAGRAGAGGQVCPRPLRRPGGGAGVRGPGPGVAGAGEFEPAAHRAVAAGRAGGGKHADGAAGVKIYA